MRAAPVTGANPRLYVVTALGCAGLLIAAPLAILFSGGLPGGSGGGGTPGGSDGGNGSGVHQPGGAPQLTTAAHPTTASGGSAPAAQRNAIEAPATLTGRAPNAAGAAAGDGGSGGAGGAAGGGGGGVAGGQPVGGGGGAAGGGSGGGGGTGGSGGSGGGGGGGTGGGGAGSSSSGSNCVCGAISSAVASVTAILPEPTLPTLTLPRLSTSPPVGGLLP